MGEYSMIAYVYITYVKAYKWIGNSGKLFKGSCKLKRFYKLTEKLESWGKHGKWTGK
jgi:hypothetical protein